jgi:hypothetical protein
MLNQPPRQYRILPSVRPRAPGPHGFTRISRLQFVGMLFCIWPCVYGIITKQPASDSHLDLRPAYFIIWLIFNKDS